MKNAPSKAHDAIQQTIAHLQQMVDSGQIADDAEVTITVKQKGAEYELGEEPEGTFGVDDLDLMEPIDEEKNPMLAHVMKSAVPVKTMKPRYRISNEDNGPNERIAPTSKYASKRK